MTRGKRTGYLQALRVLVIGCLCLPGVSGASSYLYTISVDPDLAFLDVQVDVEAESANSPAGSGQASFRQSYWTLSARQGRARDVSRLRACEPQAEVTDARKDARKDSRKDSRKDAGSEADLSRTMQGRVLKIPAHVQCLQFRVALDSAAFADRLGHSGNSIRRTAVASPARFMWLPDENTWPDIRVQIARNRFVLNGGKISVPWPQLHTQTYRIPESPHSSTSMAVFGQFTELNLPHLTKPAAFVGSAQHASKMQQWLSAQARTLQDVSGHFPNPDLQVLIFSVEGRGRSPVPFGHVIRDQGETVAFYVEETRPLADLNKDWTAAHEFSHVLLPYIRGTQKWISEGFASYYQNVLQARGGFYTEAEAWSRLQRSFTSASEQSKHLSPNDTGSAEFWDARMLIYWSGAAMALHADVALRARKTDPISLDELLGRFRGCCLPSARTWQGRDFFARLDALGGDGVMLEVYDSFANQMGMPPTAELFRALGVTRGGALTHAPLAATRRMIMRRHEPL